MTTINVSAYTTSAPFDVGRGYRVTLSGAAVLEYTDRSMADIRNGVVTWVAWPLAGSAGMADVTQPMICRVTAGASPVVVTVDPTADPLLLDPIVFWQVQGTSATTGLITATNAVTVIGDSIAAYGNQNQDGSFTVSSKGSFSNSHIAWCNDYVGLNGVPFEVVSSLAVGGAVLSTILGSQLTAALADTSDGLWIHGSVNNFNSAGGENETLTQIMARWVTALSTIQASAKKYCIVDAVHPVLQSGSTSAKARAAEFRSFNEWLRTECAKYSKIIYNNTYDVMLDSASQLLNPVSSPLNYVRTDDGIHFTSAGAQAAGYQSAKNIFGSGRLALTEWRTRGSSVLPSFSGTGGTVTAGSGTITGTPPVGWNAQIVSAVAGSMTFSTLAPGKIRVTYGNAGASACTMYLQVPTGAGMVAAAAAGTYIQAGVRYQVSGATVGLNRIACSLQFNGNTTWNGKGQDTVNEPTITYPQTNHAGAPKTPPFLVPVAPSAVVYIIAVNLAAGGSAVIDFDSPFYGAVS